MSPAPIVGDMSAWIERCASLPKSQDKVEVRFLSLLVTGGFMLFVVEPLVYLLFVPDSMVARIATMAWSIHIVWALFLLCLVATIPHFLYLAFWPRLLWKKWPRRLASWAAICASVNWACLAALAFPVDVGPVWIAYSIRAVCALTVGLAYGISVNAQQIREHAPKAP